MPKSLVEKYQQILENDAGSLVFLELAKALLEGGKVAQAAEICRRGIEHHPDSVVGRVLWGKALIISGRPTEAMEQFDQAIAVDRENPYAYNLIGEVLLHKRLYRSALPVLRRAAALQPSDRRVRQWLDQAQRAVDGAPPSAPAPAPSSTPTPTPEHEASIPRPLPFDEPEPIPADAGARTAGPSDALEPAGEDPLSAVEETIRSMALDELEKTPLVPIRASLVAQAALGAPPAPGPAAAPDLSPVPMPAGIEAEARPQAGSDDAPPAAGDPPALTPVPTPPALASLAAARPEDAPLVLAPPALGLPAGAPPAESARRAEEPPRLNGASAAHSSNGAPRGAAAASPAAAPSAGEGSVQVAPELLAPRRARPASPLAPKRLLAELPTLPPHPAAPEPAPSVVIAPEAAADIARAYEDELRERLLQAPPPTFLRRHWLKLSVALVATAAIVALPLMYLRTRERNKGNDLIALRSQAFGAIALDTPRALRDALDAATRALALSADDPDSVAAEAFAHALLFHDFGRDPAHEAAARRALEPTRARRPALALTLDWLLAGEEKDLAAAQGAIRAALQEKPPKVLQGALSLEAAELLSLDGRLLLREGQPEALDRFREALERDPRHVPTLLALGDYYLSQSEPEDALKWFRAARTSSPDQLVAALGIANAQLALGVDPGADLAQARELFAAPEAGWPPGLKAGLDLAEGRALALRGRSADAIHLLDAGASEHRERAADFLSALGQVQALLGDYAKAEAAFARALDRRPGDPALLEELGRALLAQGRAADALRRLDGAGPEDRRLHVVRGLARLELRQLSQAREELALTTRNGKVPTEAAVSLAQIDLAQGQAETARAVLESAARAARGRAAAQVALGRLALEQGREADAQAAFRAAEAERRDWEGACSLGRLELKASHPAEAVKHLSVALERNRQHLEARLARAQALLGLGDLAGARQDLEASIAQASQASSAVPASSAASARRLLARVGLASGEVAAARRSLAEAARLEPRHPELPRLAALIALASGNTAEGLKGLEQATRASPSDPIAYCELGEAQLKLGNAAAARSALQVALRLEPGHLRARLGLVAATLPQGARGAAKESEELVQATRGSPLAARALALNARVHLALGELKVGLERAQAAVAADDSSADAHLALALAANNGRPRDDRLAVAQLLRVVAADPVIAEAHLALAESLARDEKQEHGRAIAELETYLRIAPRGPYADTARRALVRLRKKAGP